MLRVCVFLLRVCELIWKEEKGKKDDMTEKVIKIDDGTRKNNKGRRK